MPTINFGSTVSLKEAAQLICASPDVRYLLRGEPGIGKSSIMKSLREMLGEGYAYAYFDCAQKDLGDICMPSVNREKRVTEYFPNAVLQLHTGKPVVIMLDEYTKAPQPVQNMLHPLLEAHNPRLGDIPLPEGSIIILTGNLSSDSVGDMLKAHSRNRLVEIVVQKPSAEDWLEWAVNSDIEPVVMAWSRATPQVFASYTDDGEAENPYIYNPKKMQMAFVSPRSLERASKIVRSRSKVTANALTTALRGCIGEAAARDMDAYIAFQDQLPVWESVIKNPKGAAVPESPGACSVLVFGAIQRVDKESIGSWMDYLERMEPEWQAVFCINIAKSKKQNVAFESSKFTAWVTKNTDLL